MKIEAIVRTSEEEHFSPLEVTLKRTRAKPNVLLGEEVGRPFQGFGGAITEASAYVLSLMDETKRNEVLQRYYSKSGLNYVLGRVAIGASDFALGSYDYLDGEDKSLQSFSLRHEERYLFSVLEEIKKIKGQPLVLLASPWSPCAWMKDNHDILHGGHLLAEDYPLWAEYECRFVEGMAQQGFPIAMISIQNEPEAVQVWESCLYSAEEEGRFALVLREKLDQHGLRDVAIYLWDHNRDVIRERARVSLSDPRVNAAVAGIAFHWYVSEDFSQVRLTHEEHPDKHLLFSEGCIETTNQKTVKMGAFKNGERYARNIIGDLSSFTEGWIDWNIVLDEEGGPNHVGNFCEAPVQYLRKSGTVLYNHSFYCIEQFSHFIQPGAQRLRLEIPAPLKGVAFRNPDGKIALVLLNEDDSDHPAVLSLTGPSCFLTLKGHSVTTYLLAQ
jgi:glucosylceramidase